MTLFTNGFVTFQMPDGFDAVPNRWQFEELSLINSKIPMSIKFKTTPVGFGLTDLRNQIEESLKHSDVNIIMSDFIAINEDIYYMIVSTVKKDDKELRRNEFNYIQDNNLYTFEFNYPYADAELDDFYLNMIRSMKISVAKYIVDDNGYRINSE